MEGLYKDQEITKAFLVGEHLTQDLTMYSINKMSSDITLQNLQQVKA